MKKTTSLFLTIAIILSAIFILSGCGTEKKGDTTESTTNSQQLDYANMKAEDLLSHIKDKSKITTEEYVWLISTYSNVKITDDFSFEKNITDEALKSIDSKAKPSQDSYMSTIIKSESPQVRGYALSLMPTLTGVSDKNLELAKELIKTETNEFVLFNAVKALSNEAKSSKEIADFLIKMASHENAKIRVQWL